MSADCVDGATPSLAAAEDFAYMRAVRPYSENDEDAFVFLSDAFVRRMVGPALKIGEARRVRCLVSLQTLAFAEMMFQMELARAPHSVDELVEGHYIGAEEIRCPDGGTYTLERGVPVCSVHGRERFMKPNLELSVQNVSPEEADAYARFRENYKQYWRRYIDPVGIRVRGVAGALEIDATILPLVENSIYSSFVNALGVEPVELGRPQVPDAVATLDVKLPPLDEQTSLVRDLSDLFGVDAAKLSRSLGDHVSLQIVDAKPTIATDFAGTFEGPIGASFGDWLVFAPLVASLTMPTVVVAPIRDRAALDATLADVRARLSRPGNHRDAWFQVENYQLVQGGARTVEAVSIRLSFLRWRIFYAAVGDQFVVATDRRLIDDIAAAASSGTDAGALRIELAPARWKLVAPSLALAYAEDSRRVCLSNLSWEDALRGAFAKTPRDVDDGALSLLGATFACPGGGRYVVGANGRVECTVHGHAKRLGRDRFHSRERRRRSMLEGVRRIEAKLTFTKDGLNSRIRIE